MNYIDRLRTDATLWLLLLIVGGIGAAIVYVALTSITF